MKGTLVSTEIAEPYAQALLSVAQSSNLLDRFSGDVKSLLQLLKDSPQLNDFIGSPVMKEGAKKEVLTRVMGSEVHPYLLNFLMLLVDKRRIAFLEPVCEQFLILVRGLTNTVLAEVTSATQLSDSQLQTVIDKVKTLTAAEVVELSTSVDPGLIGGVIIKVGSQVLDASIRGQLQRIGNSLGRSV
ncbi:MAG: ATP synthase subunit delta [Chroococcopsis gigantea SAG 12.99]|jgi:F-type H+-transporting ATPase subunit delta|nr:F0F1 ATP synthase subunit delta [Chlorogloea purpurea SAG 13.99]MDV3002221.1 ATP synthase subunit delta [Chroococcopsis gigantea SAG 12.99]